MIQDKKIVVVIPAGRRRYMELLVSYLLRETDVIDEIRFWMNTNDRDDINWIEHQSLKSPIFTKDKRRWNGNFNQGVDQYYQGCIDEDSIYVKIDDDMLWLGKDCVKKLATYRVQNPEPFIVYANIFNNAICDYINMANGLYDGMPSGDRNPMCGLYYNDSATAYCKHEYLLQLLRYHADELPDLKPYVLKDFEKVSINCIAWLGKDFNSFKGVFGHGDETCFSNVKPQELKRPCVIVRDAYCVHYAFRTQRDYLERSTILERYRELLNLTISEPKPKIITPEPITVNFMKYWNKQVALAPIVIPSITSKEIHLLDGCCRGRKFIESNRKAV